MASLLDSDDEDNALFLSTLKLRCSPRKSSINRFVPVAETSVADVRSRATDLFDAASSTTPPPSTRRRPPPSEAQSQLTLISCCIGATENVSLFPPSQDSNSSSNSAGAAYGTTTPISSPTKRGVASSPQSPKRPREEEHRHRNVTTPSSSSTAAKTPSTTTMPGGKKGMGSSSKSRGGVRVEELDLSAPIPFTWILEEASKAAAAAGDTSAAHSRVRAYCEANNLRSPLYDAPPITTPIHTATTTPFSIADLSAESRALLYNNNNTTTPRGSFGGSDDRRFDVGRLSGTFKAADDDDYDDGYSHQHHSNVEGSTPLADRSLLTDYPPPLDADDEHNEFLAESARVLSQVFDDGF